MADNGTHSTSRIATSRTYSATGFDQRDDSPVDPKMPHDGDGDGTPPSCPVDGHEQNTQERRLDGDCHAGLVVIGFFPEACLSPGHPAFHTVEQLSFLQFTDGVDAFVATNVASHLCQRIAADRQLGIAVLSDRDVALARRFGLDYDSVDDRGSPTGAIVLVEPWAGSHEAWTIRDSSESRVIADIYERLTENRKTTDQIPIGVTYE